MRGRFALLCAATFLHFTAMGLLLAVLPQYLSDELSASRAVVGLVVGGGFSVAAVGLRPVIGRQLDRRGRRMFLAGGPLLLAAATLPLLAARVTLAVVALRVLQGAAGASYYTSAATVATDLAPEERRAEYISRFSLFLYAGFAIGPALGEALLDRGGFALAWGAAASAAAIAGGLAACLPETRPRTLPPPSLAIGWRRLVHPAALGPGAVLITAAVGYTAISVFSPLYADSIHMESSGPLYTSFAVTVLAVRLLGGRLADRHGRVNVALPGLAAAATGLGLLALVPRPVPAMLGVALFGAGFALVFPALMALTADRAAEADRGGALGSFTAFYDVGAAVGGYAVGAVADAAGFGAAFGGAALLCLVGAALLVRLGHSEATARASDQPLPEPAGT